MKEDDSIGFIISTLGRKLSQCLALQFYKDDITTEQWSVLNRLTEQDGITQREISARTEKDPTNITRILDQLERKGWIRREANSGDRRSLLAYVTDSGRQLNARLAPMEAELMKRLTSVFTEQQLATLRQSLLQLDAAVQAELHK